MKILLWHGYLMSGSGSNVYTVNVAAAWRKLGHEVLVMCQQRGASRFEAVDAEGDFTPDNLGFELTGSRRELGPGSCAVLRPDISGLLPVYVYDDYDGFVVKTFVDLTDEELDRYVSTNVAAMVTALERFRPDVVITGHEVMGPYIAKLACEQTGHRFIAKLHGSALEYAVKLQDRYLHYAAAGLGAAYRVVGGSRYMLAEAASVVPGWAERATVVNPGVDVDLFRPAPGREPGTTVGFVGKLIAEKGAHDLLVAIGTSTAADLRVVMVGYGGDEDALRALAAALKDGRRDHAVDIVRDLKHSDAAVSWLRSAGDEQMARFAEVEVDFTGRLEHGPLSVVLPTFDVLVVPSVVAEAFGMVAAEAAACGVLPLVPGHSGISEAGEAVEEALGETGLLRFDHTDPVAGIASGIDRLLAIAPQRRAAMGRTASELAIARWSWERVAERLLEAAV